MINYLINLLINQFIYSFIYFYLFQTFSICGIKCYVMLLSMIIQPSNGVYTDSINIMNTYSIFDTGKFVMTSVSTSRKSTTFAHLV